MAHQTVLVVAIVSGAVCVVIGFGGGALLTKPNREKTKSIIAAVEAEAMRVRTITQKQIQSAKAKIIQLQNKTNFLTTNNLKRVEETVKDAAKERDNTKAEIALLKSKLVTAKRTSKRKKSKLAVYNKQETLLRRELKYLYNISEIKWVRFDSNTVYIGFDPYPSDGNLIIKGAALRGNKAIDFGCHVWAVHTNQINNPPHYGTFGSKWYGEATARYGRII